MLKTSTFFYVLPPHLIAQTPLLKRDQSRLLVLDKVTKKIEHKTFNDIINYLNAGDVLVLNDTKVIPARLIGQKLNTKGQVEVLLLKNIKADQWECLIKPGRRVKTNTIITFGALLTGNCIKEKEDGIKIIEFNYQGSFYDILKQIGEMPLPPYIYQKIKNKEQYQTLYAHNIGSVAAPTAGFHFTKELLTKIKDKGVHVVFITLHVGLGTFRPVKTEYISDHKMHAEYYQMNQKTANILNKAKEEGKNIIGVGTTTARVLETIKQQTGHFVAKTGWTNIFIYPPYQFQALDCLITNFHLPQSTLLMLVSAFANKEFVLKAYQIAIANEYRFFSFGDSMLIK